MTASENYPVDNKIAKKRSKNDYPSKTAVRGGDKSVFFHSLQKINFKSLEKTGKNGERDKNLKNRKTGKTGKREKPENRKKNPEKPGKTGNFLQIFYSILEPQAAQK